MQELFLLVTFMACVFFLAGVDHGMDKASQATRGDRHRIYCETPGHMKMFCADQQNIPAFDPFKENLPNELLNHERE